MLRLQPNALVRSGSSSYYNSLIKSKLQPNVLVRSGSQNEWVATLITIVAT